MAYELKRLAPGSYDVLHHGRLMASLVRSGSKENVVWTVELLEELLPNARPAPFTDSEHSFSTFEEAREWLQVPVIDSEGIV